MDSIPANLREAALRFGEQSRPTVCKCPLRAEPAVRRLVCPTQAEAFRAGPRPGNIRRALFQVAPESPTESMARKLRKELTRQFQTRSIQSNPSQKNSPREALRAAPK